MARARAAPHGLAVVATAALLMAGCVGGTGQDPRAEAIAAWDACRLAPAQEHVLYFASGNRLDRELPPAGSVPGNAFSSAFLTNELDEWLSAPQAQGLWLVGNVTLEYWLRSTGSPAPIVLRGDPGEGYHVFAQFGSDRSLQPAYAVHYAPALPVAGTIDHYVDTLPMPPGGFVVEAGDAVRVLLTDLALDGPGGSGHDVLYGGDTPSQVRFTARCFPTLAWPRTEPVADEAIDLPGNQGLLTGAIAATEGVNQQTVNVTLPAGTRRVTIHLTQTGDPNPVKDDIDLTLLAGNATWGIGSPYSDEQGTLWLDNLRAFAPDGAFQVRVDSYSGIAYSGRLLVTAQTSPELA